MQEEVASNHRDPGLGSYLYSHSHSDVGIQLRVALRIPLGSLPQAVLFQPVLMDVACKDAGADVTNCHCRGRPWLKR